MRLCGGSFRAGRARLSGASLPESRRKGSFLRAAVSAERMVAAGACAHRNQVSPERPAGSILRCSAFVPGTSEVRNGAATKQVSAVVMSDSSTSHGSESGAADVQQFGICERGADDLMRQSGRVATPAEQSDQAPRLYLRLEAGE